MNAIVLAGLVSVRVQQLGGDGEEAEILANETLKKQKHESTDKNAKSAGPAGCSPHWAQ